MSAEPSSRNAPADIELPDSPALCVNAREAAILTADGEIKILPHERARAVLRGRGQNAAVLVCHAPHTRQRLGLEDFHAVDVLELFAFVHPAAFCTPSVPGLCKALGLDPPGSFEDTPLALFDIAKALLTDLRKDPLREKADPLKIAGVMGMRGKGWAWTPFVFSARGIRKSILFCWILPWREWTGR